LDGDGKVLFSELAAFVAAANAAVTNPVYRLTPYIRPPLGEPDFPVIDYADARAHTRVRVDTEGARRVILTDDELVRYADLNLEEGFAPLVHLPRAGTWWFRIGEREIRVEAGPDEEFLLSEQPASERVHVSAKGVDSYLRRHLFQIPFGSGFAEEYLDGTYAESLVFSRRICHPWYTNGWGWGAVTTGILATSIATVFHFEARHAGAAARDATFANDVDRYNREVEHHNLAAGFLYGVGGAAAVAGALVFILDDRWEERRIVPFLDKGKTALRPGLGSVWLERTF